MDKDKKHISIYRYFHLNQAKDIFSNLSQLEFSSVDEFLSYIKEHNLAVKSYNEDYLKRRFETEQKLYSQFIDKGGKPKIKHPYYFTLGKCDEWFYGRKGSFGCVEFFLDEFDPNVVSFTYGDSIPTYMEQFQDGKEYRNKVFTWEEIQYLIKKYGMPNCWNTYEQFGPENYIEVQIWTDKFTSLFSLESTNFNNLSVNELAIRMIGSNKNISEGVSNQKSLDYFIRKSKNHPKWIWFCELINRIPSTVFCLDYVHGIPHAHKCAFLAFIIAVELDLSLIDFNTLIYAALFHDVGRKDFESGKNHGVVSSEKVESFILETDKVHIKQLKEALVKHEEQEIMDNCSNIFLIWLRDIDSLDYLRLGFGQYTTKKLITKVAKSLIKCVIELNVLMYLEDHQFIYNLVNEVRK